MVCHAPEVDVGRGEIVDALVTAPVVVVRDEYIDLSFEIAGQIIVLEQDAVLECLMPALDFPLRHRMIRRTTRMSHILPLEPFGQVRRGRSSTRCPIADEVDASP